MKLGIEKNKISSEEEIYFIDELLEIPYNEENFR